VIQTETAQPTVGEPVVDIAELKLVSEVESLWLVHSNAKTSLHQSRDELKRIRTDLSQRLYQLKSVLSRPGRGGAWSSFLAAQKIPRSTGDRLVRAHEKALSRDGNNCASEQIQEPIEVVVHRYVRALWPKLSKILTSPESVQVFIAELNRTAEKSFAGKRPVSSPAKNSDLPSYLRHLDLPVIAASNNAALA
jgi:hypothetical protein